MLTLQADLSDFFKKIDRSAKSSNLPEIDFIYMINLDQRPEKYASCLEQALPLRY